MSKPLRSIWIYALVTGALLHLAHADGGRLRFSRNTGPFIVTLFTAPEPLTPGPVDFSVMVQDAATGEILPSASILLNLDSTNGRAISVSTNHKAATNKLLQAAEVILPTTGKWHVHLEVAKASRHAACDSEIVVQPGSRMFLQIWIFALLPVVATVLFVLHQRQRQLREQRL